METVVILPDVESLVSVFLQHDPDVQAAVGTFVSDGAPLARVYTALPKDVAFPVVRVTLIDETKMTQRPLWVVTAMLQLEAWGNTQWDATRALRTVQGVLAARVTGVHSRGIVTGVRFGGMRNVPDPEFAPAKPRRIVVAQVTAHPAPG